MGSAALFFALMPRAAILSDVNGELVNAFNTIRRHPRAVYSRATAISRTRGTYDSVRALDPRDLKQLDRAARFLFLNRNCFNGLYRTNVKGQFNVPYSPSGTGAFPSWEQFAAAAKVLRRALVVNQDFEQTIAERVREADFVYLDPPFAVDNRRVFRQYDPHTFGTDDLARLSRCLRDIDRKGAKFVLSYAASPEAREYFGEWSTRKVYTLRNIAGFAKHRRRAAELLFTNT
jgi:DNA adenine methylase